MERIVETILASLQRIWTQVADFSPRLLAALVLFTLGWLAAKLLRRGTIKFLKGMRMDELAERAGIEDFLLKGGVRYTAVTILGGLIYWFVLFAVAVAALNTLGLEAATDLFNRIILYIPNVVVAVLVLLFGSLFGKVVRSAAFTYLNNIGIEGAPFLSAVAQWAIMIFVASVAMEQLAIGGQVLVSAFQIAFGAFCLALAIAFGLGGRDWAAHILNRLWKK